MLRKTIRRRISSDQRGKIKTGMKVEKGDKSFPKSLDHFKIDSFPELVEAYGNEPDKLFILVPSDNIEDFFHTEYNLWASKGDSKVKKRSCDGEECIHYISQEVAGTSYLPGEVTPCLCRNEELNIEEKQKCKSYTSLKTFILHPQTGKIISSMCYLFETHSDNSSDNLYTELEKIWHITGGKLVKIPFILSVKMKETNVPVNGKSEKRKFPIWYLQVFGTTEKIIDFANRKTLPTTNETALIIDEDRQLESSPELDQNEKINDTEFAQLYTIQKQSKATISEAKTIVVNFGYKTSKDILRKDYDEIVRQIERFEPSLGDENRELDI